MVAYHHRVVVQGMGHFPTDMLRYDRLAPFASIDVEHIHDLLMMPTLVTLTRMANKEWVPCADRWVSFGWNVVKHESWRA